MANSNSPRGLTPVKQLDGSPWNGATRRYAILAADGTATFVGDAVKHAGTADADGVAAVVQAAAGDVILGVVVGFEVNPLDLTQLHRAASTLRYALVCDAPDVIFEIQEDNTATFAITMIGENADLVVAAGSTVTGVSAMQLNTTTHTAATAQLRILGVVQREDNSVAANAKLEVLINEHFYKATAGV